MAIEIQFYKRKIGVIAMRKMIIDNKEIMTNYNEKSAERIVNGEDINGYDLFFKNYKESKKEFLERLVELG